MSSRIANDNVPAFFAAPYTETDNSRLRMAHPKTQPSAHLSQTPRMRSENTAPESHPGISGLTHLLWIGALLTFAASFYFQTTLNVKIIASLAIIWTGLWANYSYSEGQKWRMAEIAALSSIGGLLGLTWLASDFFNLAIDLSSGALIICLVSVALSIFVKSRIILLSSLAASLAWGGLVLLGESSPSILFAFYPAIWIAQAKIATDMQSRLSIFMTVLVGYIWLTGTIFHLMTTGVLPLIFATSLLFSVGFAHVRAGKAAEDREITGSAVHIYFGWIIAMVGAITFQFQWLSPDTSTVINELPTKLGFNFWQIVVVLSLFSVFVSGIIRYKFTQISLLGIFLITSVAALIPIILWAPNLFDDFMMAIPGMNAAPSTGIFIGAAILAVALGSILNGLRREKILLVGLGVIVVGIQAALLAKPEFLTLDYIIVFGAAFFASIAVGGIIAGNSIAHISPPPDRRQYIQRLAE